MCIKIYEFQLTFFLEPCKNEAFVFTSTRFGIFDSFVVLQRELIVIFLTRPMEIQNLVKFLLI